MAILEDFSNDLIIAQFPRYREWNRKWDVIHKLIQISILKIGGKRRR